MDTNNGNHWMNQNYPNHSSINTTIDYGLNISGNVSLVVYDLSGRIVRTLVSEYQHPDNYKVTFNLDGLQSGIYFYSLKVDNVLVKTRKMIVY
jgi:hypothetical protein